ncbi:hypothetical protein C2W64_00578 [Brevibacillus laterosporus]|nr:hypothetical protein C2W64_00578 [Brevibacillus laterosporus]
MIDPCTVIFICGYHQRSSSMYYSERNFHTPLNQQLLHHIFLIFFIAVGLSCLGMFLAFFVRCSM